MCAHTPTPTDGRRFKLRRPHQREHTQLSLQDRVACVGIRFFNSEISHLGGLFLGRRGHRRGILGRSQCSSRRDSRLHLLTAISQSFRRRKVGVQKYKVSDATPVRRLRHLSYTFRQGRSPKIGMIRRQPILKCGKKYAILDGQKQHTSMGKNSFHIGILLG